jgi:hypothetical protein
MAEVVTRWVTTPERVAETEKWRLAERAAVGVGA